MRKWIVLAIVLAVAAVAVIGASNLDAYLNRNRAWLTERLRQALGREVAFDEIGVAFAGGFGVRIKGVRIADDPAFAHGDVLRADAALIRIRLLPALSGRYEISRIALEHPLLIIRRTAAGWNVSPDLAGRDDGAGHSHDSGTGAMGTALPAAAALVIAYVDVDGGKVRYVDSTVSPPARLELDAIDLTASDVRPGKPVSFDMRASVLGTAAPNVRVHGSVGPLSLAAPADTPVHVELHATDVSVAQLAKLPGFDGLLEALAVEGPMSLAATANGTWGELGFAATLDAGGAHVRYGDVLDKARDVPMSIDVAGTRTSDAITVERATFGLLDAVVSGSGTAVTGDEPRYDVALSSGTVALAGWEGVLPWLGGLAVDGTLGFDLYAQSTGGDAPVSLGGSIALGDVALRDAAGSLIEGLTTTVTLDGTSGTVAPATFRIAGAPATFTADVKTAPKPTLTFSLECDTLPLSGSASPVRTDAVTLRAVKIDGALRMPAGSLKLRANVLSRQGNVAGVAYKDLTADMRAADGRVTFSPLTAATMGGTMRGEGVYDLRDSHRPSFNFETKIASIRVKALTAALGDADAAHVDGVADAELSIAGSGKDWKSIGPSLVGGGDIAVRDGALEGTNIVHALLTSLAGLPGLSTLVPDKLREEFPTLIGGDDTRFDRFAARVSIADGRISSDAMTVEAPQFSAKGRGVVGFDGSINVNGFVDLAQSLSKELFGHVSVLQRIANQADHIVVPVRIDGTLPHVHARPDLGHVAHALQKGAVAEFIDGILDRERKHIEHGAAPAPPKPPAADAPPAADPGPSKDWYGAPNAAQPDAAKQKPEAPARETGKAAGRKTLRTELERLRDALP